MRTFSADDDGVDRLLDVAARELVGGVLDVDVVGGQRGLELGVVEREQRRGAGHDVVGAWRAGGGTRRGRPAGARESPRSPAPGRSARPCWTRCWRGGRAPRRSGRPPRRDGRRCTAPHPSASARTRQSGSGCRPTGLDDRAGRPRPRSKIEMASWAGLTFDAARRRSFRDVRSARGFAAAGWRWAWRHTRTHRTNPAQPGWDRSYSAHRPSRSRERPAGARRCPRGRRFSRFCRRSPMTWSTA